MTALTARADRRLIRPDRRSERFVLVELTAPPAAPRDDERPPVNLSFVIDRSGSMTGEKLDLAKRASWAEAESHLRRAVELDPAMMMYAVDLATLYGRADRAASRDSVLARIRTMPLVHPMDRTIRDATLARWTSP